MTAAPTPPRVRPTRLVVALAIAIAVVGAIVTWRTLHDERPEARVGQVVSAADALPGTRSSFVLLPSGRLDVRATAALDDVDGDATVRALQAPGDGSFVGIEIVRTAPGAGDAETLADVAGGGPYGADTSLALVADGRRYELRSARAAGGNTPLTPPGRWYVAVDGSPRALALEVTYGGRSQEVDLRTGAHRAGDFAPLYAAAASAPSSTERRSCGAGVIDDRLTVEGRPAVCEVGVTLLTPYVDRLGWANAGKAWLLVPTRVRPADGYLDARRGGDPIRRDSSGAVDLTFTLAGQPSREEFRQSVRDTVVAFAVSPSTGTRAGTLEVAASVRLYANGDTGYSSARTFAVTRWSVPV